MKCPLCGYDLAIVKTICKSDTLVRRTRQCTGPLCPYVDCTFEMLNDPKAAVVLNEIFELLREISKTIGSEPVLAGIHRLSDEITRKSKGGGI